MSGTETARSVRRRSRRVKAAPEGDRPLHLGCLVESRTHHAVRAHAAEKGITIRRLLLTALRDAGVPIPAREIEEGHR